MAVVESKGSEQIEKLSSMFFAAFPDHYSRPSKIHYHSMKNACNKGVASLRDPAVEIEMVSERYTGPLSWFYLSTVALATYEGV